ncbi:MAG: PAQR family membrane homeostasis protein TrhA [Microthrixaceae bacterium]|jgi:hemolysin III
MAAALVDAYGFRPFWRGRLHLIAALLAAPAVLVLAATADTGLGRAAVLVFGATLVGLYAVSASYHRLAHTPTAVKWWRRADHSMIFMLIAGTYTPICLLALPPEWGIPTLVVVWIVAMGGVTLKMAKLGVGNESVGSWLYIVLGWAGLLIAPLLVTRLAWPQLVLLAVGGVLYTVGAVVLGKRRPDPSPERFGYHEVWHSMTIVAGGCHFFVVATLLP